jgi:hypothetical protein
LDLSIALSTEALAKAEASAKLDAAWRSFTPACRVAQLYAGLPRGAALRGHNSRADSFNTAKINFFS